MPSVPVAPGSNGPYELEMNFDSAKGYIPAEGVIDKCVKDDGLCAASMLEELFDKAPPKSIQVNIIACMTDVAEFMKEEKDLFIEKTKNVCIMGGVKDFDDEERKKGGLRIKPDSAYNNQCDMEASEYVYAMCQEWKVPMIVLTRHAAYACPIPRVVYEDMAKTGHPIAVRLYNEQKNSILSLWKRATSPIGDPTREELPDRCDKEWFCKTFMGGKGHDQDVSERSERALRKTRNI